MPEHFFTLSDAERRDVLEVASNKSGRPVHLLEKDIWVVWALEVLFTSEIGHHLVFKGGTSLSKAYQAIDRFSEDVDLTYDIRAIASDLVSGSVAALPRSNSQADTWTRAIRERLTLWTKQTAAPLLEAAAEVSDSRAMVAVTDDTIEINYAPLMTYGTGYVSPIVKLEFGARSTGEPWEVHEISCDVAPHVSGVSFPIATSQVMKAERTFWEKATSIHVYCVGGRFRNTTRFSRHWYDLTRLARIGCAGRAIDDQSLAEQVAHHKSRFFREKDGNGLVIDYLSVVKGAIRLIPEDTHRDELADDYRRMTDDGLLVEPVESFDELIAECERLQDSMNGPAPKSANSAPQS
ncbi:MAG TPA: nucleotidyl transferase AbiEii/AbiGii toxin family protein [Methylomirabilota bacterium]|nr:nucleotidyl transferase AbiEii/AbiGii toxin family protein [Methylomirabilota bacterium]